jgi:hypothetical protein
MLPAILPPLAGGRRALLGDESVQGEILYRLSRRLEKEGVITKLERSRTYLRGKRDISKPYRRTNRVRERNAIGSPMSVATPAASERHRRHRRRHHSLASVAPTAFN